MLYKMRNVSLSFLPFPIRPFPFLLLFPFLLSLLGLEFYGECRGVFFFSRVNKSITVLHLHSGDGVDIQPVPRSIPTIGNGCVKVARCKSPDDGSSVDRAVVLTGTGWSRWAFLLPPRLIQLGLDLLAITVRFRVSIAVCPIWNTRDMFQMRQTDGYWEDGRLGSGRWSPGDPGRVG